ncbi:uncharacterized protein ALTATR162_LOCUS9803 [Alternaria atra]|uniref:Uncharacterized protein n=1 Tax=Alternaria atra TaxID=119953 RepID=A0A8J2ID01_9PLEO|nr:uncharacterized protein ALTATR162_LOCUS9803 [Alternaria atra]CAG5181724.1 unnamed protein product [Alternaria atra]
MPFLMEVDENRFLKLGHLYFKVGSPKYLLCMGIEMTRWLFLTARFVVRALYDYLTGKGLSESRMICIPAPFVAQLRARAMSELASEAKEPFWLSAGDVLCGWWARIIVAAGPPASPQQEIVINNVLGLRMLYDLIPPEKAYISNALMMMPSFFTAKDLLGQPLGCSAFILRQAVTNLKTREQIEARFQLDRGPQQRGLSALYGSAGMRMIICTNWSKNKIHEVDFSAAVLKSGDRKRPSKVGRPSYTQLHAFAQSASFLNTFSINEDSDGNYWIYSLLPTRGKYWENVEDLLQEEFQGATADQVKK